MKLLYGTTVLLLLLLTNTLQGSAQDQGLRLTTAIAGARYCAAGPDVDALRMTLNLRYTNTGTQKLILYRGDRLFYQIFVSRTPEEASVRRHELRTSHARYYDEVPEKIKSPSPGGAFVTLAPGASYETRQVISVPVARSGAGRYNVSVGPGEHFLHVVASTWYESKSLAQELRERWQRSGLLWTEPVASNFVGFMVATDHTAAPCR